MSETKFVMVHVMVGEKSEASEIARAVVGQRLAACANILPGARSVYWWNGSLEEADECLLVLKTRRELAERLVAEIARLHSLRMPGACHFADRWWLFALFPMACCRDR